MPAPAVMGGGLFHLDPAKMQERKNSNKRVEISYALSIMTLGVNGVS